MKKITLTLTKEKWWEEIKNNPNISDLSKSKLPSAINSWLKYNSPPIMTAYLNQDNFQRIKNEIESITFDGKPLFIVCETHPDFLKIRVTDEKSPNWDETIFAPGKDYDEGLPVPELNLGAPREDRIYLVRTFNNGEHYVPYLPASETCICTIEGYVISKKKITGWFRVC